MDEDQQQRRDRFEAMVRDRYLATGATADEFEAVKDELLAEARKRAALNPASMGMAGQTDGGDRAENRRRYR